ncbi:MAG: YIP1 family protein [Methanosarcinales archaeon]
MTVLEKVKGFMFSPTETFNRTKQDTIEGVFLYFIVLLLIYAVLFSVSYSVSYTKVVQLLGPMLGPKMPFTGEFGIDLVIIAFAMAYAGGTIVTLTFALWLHLWVHLIGGGKGVEQTLKAILYGITPYLVFGWIPLIFLIALIWAIVVEIIGVRQLHEIPTGKAALAYIIAGVIPIIVYVAIFEIWYL